jgi:hypothetical protein
LAVVHYEGDSVYLAAVVRLAGRGEGKIDKVLEPALPEERFLFFPHHSDDFEGNTAHGYPLPKRALGTEDIHPAIVREHAHHLVILVGAKEASLLQLDWPNPLDLRSGCQHNGGVGILSALHTPEDKHDRHCHGDAGYGGERGDVAFRERGDAQSGHRVGIAGPIQLAWHHEDGIRAQPLNLAGHIHFHALPYGDEHNHGAHSDGDAQRGESCAQPVANEGAVGTGEVFTITAHIGARIP